MDDLISRQAAIEEYASWTPIDEYERRISKAIIDTLEKLPKAQRWIPVTERLPEDDRKVLCQTVTKKGIVNFVIGYHYGGGWACGMNSNVVAWMPLPEPWKGEQP